MDRASMSFPNESVERETELSEPQKIIMDEDNKK